MYFNKNKVSSILLSLLSLCFFQDAFAQDANILNGTVFEINEQGQEASIIGANVYWANTTIGTFTIGNGSFSIERSPDSQELVVSYVGFANDTMRVSPELNDISILLDTGKFLDEISVTAKNKSTFISSLQPIKVEKLTGAEFEKAACCNLSESFETNATVDVNYTDAVTGAKEIRMLGLNGIYTQLLVENMPGLRGLSSVFGLDYIPGTWMESIQITKGVGSIVNGYESIAGQINVELKKPEEAEKLLVNLYANQAGRLEANINVAHKINDKLYTALLVHGNYFDGHHDRNDDHFLDLPNKQQFNIINRYKYISGQWRSQFGVKYLTETREGGQIAHHFSNPYQTIIDNNRIEGFAKIGWLSPKCSSKSVGLQANFAHHELDAFYGSEAREENKRQYNGDQNALYMNLVYQGILFNKNHGIRVGSSLVWDQYDEEFNGDAFQREEIVPGIFTEYAYSATDKFKVVAGIRADFHNLYGAQVSPRLHAKYSFKPESTVRLSVGRGFRKANIIAENLSLLATGRTFDINPEVHQQVESAWNMGINFVQDVRLASRDMVLSLDLYRTAFDNRTILDTYTDPTKVLVYNLTGKSFSNVMQIQLDYEALPGLDVRLAYKLEDVKTTFSDGELRNIPLNARHRGLVGLSYKPNKKWQFDANTNIVGEQLLNLYITDTQIETSPAFSTTHLQISYFMKRFEWYIGANNLFNYRQENPIISANNPYSETFNATNVWGPIFGTMAYAGMRFRIK